MCVKACPPVGAVSWKVSIGVMQSAFCTAEQPGKLINVNWHAVHSGSFASEPPVWHMSCVVLSADMAMARGNRRCRANSWRDGYL
jgi:hypothetical protein